MKFKLFIAIFSAGACLRPVQAAEVVVGTTTRITPSTTTTMNTTTIAASTVLSPGGYMATIAPSFNSGMSGRLEKALGKVRGVTSASARSDDSSIHFTVKNGSSVRVSDIQQAVVKANTGAVMSTPILEHSLTSSPGL